MNFFHSGEYLFSLLILILDKNGWLLPYKVSAFNTFDLKN